MNRDRLKYLIDVCKSQRATSEERIELENWYESFGYNADVTDLLDEESENRIRLQIWDRLEASPELRPIFNKGIKQINIFQSFFFRHLLLVVPMHTPPFFKAPELIYS